MMTQDEPIAVLLVDDQPQNLLALEGLLGNQGVDLLRAASGAEALRQLLERDVALVLLDVMMPEMDGYETAALIRQRPRSRGTPIIFLTAGATDAQQSRRGYALGAVDILAKPIVPEALQAKVGVFVELHRRALELQRREQATFLAEAGALLASSLDYEATIQAVAGLAVPRIAEWCAVDMLQPDGTLRSVAVAHADRAKVALAHELRRRYPPDPAAPQGAYRVLRTGEPLLMPEITDEMLAAAARDREHLRILRELGLASYMCVPLRAHGRILGAITFIAGESGRRFELADLALAQGLAHHAALAAENARLYTEAVQTQHQLQASEERYRVLAETASDAIVAIDEASTILYANPAAERIFGHTSADRLGQSLTMLMPDYLRQVHQMALLRYVETGRRHIDWEGVALPGLHRDGREIPLEVSFGETVQGGRHVFTGIIRDVSERARAEAERRKLEERLQQAQKLESLAILAGGIAHDFNNLLMGMLGHASLALLKLPHEAPARPSVEQIEVAATRAAELTNQMLAYSGKGRFVIRALDLSKLVEEMAHLLRVSISKKAVLKYSFAPGLPAVEADATQLRQVVMNLITNASDAIGERSGVITITTGAMDVDHAYLTETYLDAGLPSGLYVYVEVSDTGAGMDAETRARIFDPFFTTKFTGRGLGLAAVLGIVRGHKGALKVYSEPGKGTTFKVLFPAAGRAGDEPTGSAGGVPAAWESGSTVLIADDEETVRAVAKLMLEEHGFRVLTAADGREAVAVFRQHVDEIDLVLLDMTMPHLSGEEVFREIRRIRPDAAVVLSSGYNEQDAISHFAGKGLAGFIQKPYRAGDLIAKVAEALHLSA